MNRHKRKKRGFSLTELAIVLGIAGIIIGAIWAAAGSVSSSQKIETTNGQFLAITQGIRSLYSTSTSTEGGAVVDGFPLTANLSSANIFPSNMVLPTTGAITDLWGGAVSVTATSGSTASAGDAFSIQMDGLDQKGCIGILVGQGGQSRDSGLIYLVGGAAPTAYPVGAWPTPLQPATLSFPITPAEANGACAAAGSNIIIAVFKLKG